MAGLNLRIDRAGKNIYFQNKDNFLANICLDSESLGIIRVFNIKEVKNLIKFEADCVGSEIVALGSTGILKISEKNMVYKMATASIYFFFNSLFERKSKILCFYNNT